MKRREYAGGIEWFMPSKRTNGIRQQVRKIVLVIFDQATLLDIAGPMQVFNDARLDNGDLAYQVTLASAAGGPVVTDTGVVLDSERIDEAMSLWCQRGGFEGN